MHLPERVGLIGSPWLVRQMRLYAAEPDALVPLSAETETEWPPVGAAIGLWPCPDEARDRQVERRFRRLRIPYLRVVLDGGSVFAGPWSVADEVGCPACADERRRSTQPLPLRLKASQGGRACTLDGPLPWTPPSLHAVFSLLETEAERWLRGGERWLQGGVFVLDPSRLTGRVHRYLPVGTCPECGPQHSPEPWAMGFEGRVAAIPGTHRVRPLPGVDHLRQLLVDERFGLIPRVYLQPDSTSLPLAVAEVPSPGGGRRYSTVGRTTTVTASQAIALLEGLERYASTTPRGFRPVVTGSFSDLRADAVDPASFGLEGPEADLPGHPHTPYHPDRPYRWVWGYSFARNRSVLVPEQLVYYERGSALEQSDPRFAYESSNGCALGGCLEEAVLHGLFEVAERDGFLLTWYQRRPAPRVMLDRVADQRILHLQDALEQRGYEVHIFNVTTELGIPSFWVLAVDRSGRGIQTYTAGGAHLDVEQAVLSGLVEVATAIPVYEQQFSGLRSEASELLNDANKVLTVREHILLHTIPEALHRFDFALQGCRRESIRELAAAHGPADEPADLAAILRSRIRHILEQGLDVIVIDQTPPELTNQQLVAGKVLVPGAVPMTFGHRFRRVWGLPRLLRCGGAGQTFLSPTELNPHPHPFP